MNEMSDIVIKRIFVGPNPLSLAFSTLKNEVYVTNKYLDSIGIINPSFSPQVLHVGKMVNFEGPKAIAVDSKINTVYFAYSGMEKKDVYSLSYVANEGLVMIDFKRNSVLKIPFYQNSIPNNVVVNKKSGMVYVSDFGDDYINLFDGREGGKLLGALRIPSNPLSLAVNDINGNVYVISQSNTLYILNASLKRTLKTVSLTYLFSWNPLGKVVDMAIDQRTSMLYITSANGDLIVINAQNGKVIKKIKIGESAIGVAVDAKTNMIYVADKDDGVIVVVNGKTDKIVKKIKTAVGVSLLAVNQKDGVLYATNEVDGTLTVVNAKTNEVLQNIIVERNVFGLAVDQINSKVYLFSISSGSILMY